MKGFFSINLGRPGGSDHINRTLHPKIVADDHLNQNRPGGIHYGSGQTGIVSPGMYLLLSDKIIEHFTINTITRNSDE